MKQPSNIRTGRISGGGPNFQFIKPPQTPEIAAMMEGLHKSAARIMGVDLAKGPDRTSLFIRNGAATIEIDRETFNRYNAARQPDRKALAMAFKLIAEAHGANVDWIDEPPHKGYCGAGIALRITCKGVGVMFDINNLHGGFYAVASWHNAYGAEHAKVANFSKAFGLAVYDLATILGRGLHHKATTARDDWFTLALALSAGLSLAFRGEAFEPAI